MDAHKCTYVLLDFAAKLPVAVAKVPEADRPTCKAVVPCGYFTWKSLSDHTLAKRREQCSSTALVRCGHFAWRTMSNHSLAARRAQCNDTSVVPCGYFCNADQMALVPCSFFDESFKTLSNHTLAARRAQ